MSRSSSFRIAGGVVSGYDYLAGVLDAEFNDTGNNPGGQRYRRDPDDGDWDRAGKAGSDPSGESDPCPAGCRASGKTIPVIYENTKVYFQWTKNLKMT